MSGDGRGKARARLPWGTARAAPAARGTSGTAAPASAPSGPPRPPRAPPANPSQGNQIRKPTSLAAFRFRTPHCIASLSALATLPVARHTREPSARREQWQCKASTTPEQWHCGNETSGIRMVRTLGE